SIALYSGNIDLNLFTTLLRSSCELPPEAFKCPPPLKYFLQISLQGISPIERKDNLTNSVLSTINAASLMPLTDSAYFTKPSVSPVVTSNCAKSSLLTGNSAVLYTGITSKQFSKQ